MKPAAPRKRIVIVGANFAGLTAAIQLSQDHAVTVVDCTAYFEWIPNTHELVSGVKTAKALRLSRAKILAHSGHRFVKGRVASIDAQRKTVLLEEGRELPFDACIVAVGGVSNTFGIRGADQHSYPFHGVADCERIGRRLRELDASGEPLRVVIVGGGITGVEALGEVLRRYRDHSTLSVALVDSAPRLLPIFSAKLDADLRRQCAPYPVEFHTGTRIASVSPKGVRLENGRRLASDLTIWTAGLGPAPLLRSADLARGKDIWAPVTKALQSVYAESVFVIGDAAALPKPIAKQAFHAIDMGTCAARNVERFLAGRSVQAFKPANKPLVVAFGDLQTYLIVGKTFVANPSLAAAKEALYQGFMLQMAPRGGLLQALPGVADRLIQSWDTLLRPQLLAKLGLT